VLTSGTASSYFAENTPSTTQGRHPFASSRGRSRARAPLAACATVENGQPKRCLQRRVRTRRHAGVPWFSHASQLTAPPTRQRRRRHRRARAPRVRIRGAVPSKSRSKYREGSRGLSTARASAAGYRRERLTLPGCTLSDLDPETLGRRTVTRIVRSSSDSARCTADGGAVMAAFSSTATRRP
jgi:hypothetical protein